MRRTFRNDSPSPHHFTDQAVEILPGETGTVTMPASQPVPDGLTELHRRARDEDEKPAPVRRNARLKRRETVTEPAPASAPTAEES